MPLKPISTNSHDGVHSKNENHKQNKDKNKNKNKNSENKLPTKSIQTSAKGSNKFGLDYLNFVGQVNMLSEQNSKLKSDK